MLVGMGRPSKGDRVTIAAKPERQLADAIRRNAKLLGLSAGDYVVSLVAHALEMPDSAPAAGRQPASPAATEQRPTSVAGVRRLPRGTRLNPKRVGWLIEESKKLRFEQMADRCGVSAAVFLERVVDHLETEVTDRGAPSWWLEPAPRDEGFE